MATIQKVQNKGGTSYRAIIRKNGLKPITKTFSTKRLAIAYAQQIEGNQELAEALGSHCQIILGSLILEFLAQYAKKDGNMKYRLYWWADHYGALKVNEITPVRIKAGLRKLAAQGKTSPTINRYRQALSALFNYGMEEYDLSDNPCHKVKSKPENKGRDRYLSDAERVRLLEACKASYWDKLYMATLMSITTGCRRGELLALRWTDIDFTKKLAALHDSKTGKPRRLPLTEEVIIELKKFRELGDGLLFPSAKVPSKPIEFRKSWYKALEEAEITNFVWHDLRHTCATLLAQNGANLLEIGHVLGHSSQQTTQRYAHLCVERKAELVNSILGNVGL